MASEINSFIPLFTPDINENDINAVTQVLQSGMLVQGKKVADLEERVCEYIGCKHAVAVSSGTATLHLMLHVLGIGPGDEVIIPALSYVATANVVELVGATPVFVDIDLDTFNINPNLIEEKITANTKAIMPVHEFGLPAYMEGILELGIKHNIPVLEDAACAIGSSWNGEKTGKNSYMASFSLHPRKAITSGEGGIICTNSQELAKNLRILRNHGIEIINGQMDFTQAGFNYRMTDFQAALVLSQFDRLDEQLAVKTEMARVYESNLNSKMYKTPSEPKGITHTWQTYHILVNGDRDALIKELAERGIGTNYGAQCIPAMHFYKQKYKHNSAVDFPNAWKAYTKGLALPLFYKLTKEQQQKVIQELNRNEK